MRSFATCIALIALLGLGCDSDSPTAPGGDGFELQSLVKVSQSGYEAPQRATLRSAAEWADAWTKLHEGLNPVPPRPSVDFASHFVVLAAAGTRPSGCYAIDITGVRSSIEGQPVFDVLETTPGENCICTQAITRPAHAVRVTSFPRDAEFLERVAELAC